MLPEKPGAKKEAELIGKILSLPPEEKEKIGRDARAQVEALFSKERSCRQFIAVVEMAAKGAIRK